MTKILFQNFPYLIRGSVRFMLAFLGLSIVFLSLKEVRPLPFIVSEFGILLLRIHPENLFV